VSDELVEWMHEIGSRAPAIKKLLMESATDQREAGYFHTLREIYQQPATWNETAMRVVRQENALRAILEGPGDSAGRARAVVLTGSGSSQYAGDCLAPALQVDLQLPVFSVAGGAFLTQGAAAAPPCRPCLLVSLARSGDSPESCGAVDRMLLGGDRHRHLFITCNERGKLARNYRGRPRILSIVLDDQTNDRSLVMTSSFTNMVLAARFLGMLSRPEEYLDLAASLGRCATEVLLCYSQRMAEQASRDIPIAVFLGSGCAYGAARESALKMLEMSGGRVKAFAESFLGLRHGPMAIVHKGTLVVCFLSAANPARAYELDLIRELDRKQLDARKVVVGEDIPGEILHEGDLAVECPGLNRLGDYASPLIYVLIGQILAFFRCLEVGLRPDNPSAEGIISRVVGSFQMY
jgi:tagatose-6-phosphate ketose/aldose isomerase